MRLLAAGQNEGYREAFIDDEQIHWTVLPDLGPEGLEVGDDFFAEAFVKLPENAIRLDVAVVALRQISNQFISSEKTFEAASVGRTAGHFSGFINENPG